MAQMKTSYRAPTFCNRGLLFALFHGTTFQTPSRGRAIGPKVSLKPNLTVNQCAVKSVCVSVCVCVYCGCVGTGGHGCVSVGATWHSQIKERMSAAAAGLTHTPGISITFPGPFISGLFNCTLSLALFLSYSPPFFLFFSFLLSVFLPAFFALS